MISPPSDTSQVHDLVYSGFLISAPYLFNQVQWLHCHKTNMEDNWVLYFGSHFQVLIIMATHQHFHQCCYSTVPSTLWLLWFKRARGACAKRTPWYITPLISMLTTKLWSLLRPSPLEVILIFAPGSPGEGMLL